MLTKFNLIQIFLLVLLFLPLATFSSETKKERLDFIRNLESKIQKDIPKMDMESGAPWGTTASQTGVERESKP